MARPPRADTPSTPWAIRLTDAERERVKQAARANHQRPADFARDALLCAAEDCLEDAPFVIRNSSHP